MPLKAIALAALAAMACGARTEIESSDDSLDASLADATEDPFADAHTGLDDAGRLSDGAVNCATIAGPVNTCESDPATIGYVLRCPAVGTVCRKQELAYNTVEFGCCHLPPLQDCTFGAPVFTCP